MERVGVMEGEGVTVGVGVTGGVPVGVMVGVDELVTAGVGGGMYPTTPAWRSSMLENFAKAKPLYPFLI
jgi:hypothetical protein